MFRTKQELSQGFIMRRPMGKRGDFQWISRDIILLALWAVFLENN
jgi:hypothetical protein